MSVEVLPERQSKELVVGGCPCPDVGGEGAPGVGKAAADALEVQAEPQRGIEQAPSGVVQRETAGRRLLKHAFAHQVSEHPVQGSGVAAGCGGQAIDFRISGGEEVGDPQGRDHVEAPGSAEIA